MSNKHKFSIDTDGTVEFRIMGVDKNNQHLLLFARDNQNAKYMYIKRLPA